MALIDSLQFESLHHAYIIEGDATVLVPEIGAFLQNAGITIVGNPDYTVLAYETFKVEDSAILKSLHAGKSMTAGEKKFFIIAATSVAREAEQSLLKIFEEPLAGTHFFLVTPSADVLSDTLRSRSRIIRAGGGFDRGEAKKFLDSSPAERIASIGKLIKSHDKNESSAPLRESAVSILNNIESLLRERTDMSKATGETEAIFGEIFLARQALSNRGAPTKMILEHIALMLG